MSGTGLSSSFHSSKRAALVFSSLLVASFIPHIQPGGSALGISLEKVEPDVVRVLLFLAATNYVAGLVLEFLAWRRDHSDLAMSESSQTLDQALIQTGDRLSELTSAIGGGLLREELEGASWGYQINLAAGAGGADLVRREMGLLSEELRHGRAQHEKLIALMDESDENPFPIGKVSQILENLDEVANTTITTVKKLGEDHSATAQQMATVGADISQIVEIVNSTSNMIKSIHKKIRSTNRNVIFIQRVHIFGWEFAIPIVVYATSIGLMISADSFRIAFFAIF